MGSHWRGGIIGSMFSKELLRFSAETRLYEQEQKRETNERVSEPGFPQEARP